MYHFVILQLDCSQPFTVHTNVCIVAILKRERWKLGIKYAARLKFPEWNNLISLLF